MAIRASSWSQTGSPLTGGRCCGARPGWPAPGRRRRRPSAAACRRCRVVKPSAMCGHPGPLQLDGVDRAGGEQVVADGDAVPALLGGPAVHPGAPGAVAAEERGDLVVVAGQVVLGEQVDDQRGAADLGELGLLRPRPRRRRPRRSRGRRSTARTRAGTIPWPMSRCRLSRARPLLPARREVGRSGLRSHRRCAVTAAPGYDGRATGDVDMVTRP